DDFLSTLYKDLAKSKKELEKVLQVPTDIISWPYGNRNRAFSRIANKLGFKMQYGTIYGFNYPGTNITKLKRIAVSRFDSLKRFKAKLELR
ncbi:polysaccharide deacetylase family protein, partial [Candidatus Riflebacteria bacterium]